MHIKKLAPFKASGPDSIPNIVLKECMGIISKKLATIYRVIIELKTYFPGWQDFTMCVLSKPGKPRYNTPKAYRPIVLICTMSKVLTSIIAEDLMHICKKHNIIPENHFGGQKGRTTTDILVKGIKRAWRKGDVASILFLDTEGAFPNTVTS